MSRRVAHVTRRWGVFSQPFIADQIRSLGEEGWKPWVVTGTIDDPTLFDYPPRERVVTVPRQPRLPLERLLLGPAHAPPAIRPRRALARLRPDIVHAHFGWSAVDARSAALKLGIPFTVSFRGADLTVLPGLRRWRRPYRALLDGLNHAMTSSAFLAERLRDIGMEGRIHVIPSGIALDEFPFRGALTPVEGQVRIVCVCRLVPYKGVDVLLRALPLLLDQVPDLRLDVIGEGPNRLAHEALSRELSLERTVRFRGALRRPAVREALEAAHLMVLPCRTLPSGHAEGMGNVIKEALAVGVPVVTTRSGGIPEALPPEQRSALAAPGDPAALARGIMEALDRTQQECERRAAAGRAWVEREFDLRKVAARIASVYARLLSGP